TPEKDFIRTAVRQKTIRTRPLTVFEKNAMERLAGGQHLAFGTNNGVLAVAGSLVATKECLNCHSCQEGKLLGAMSYALEEVISAKPVPSQELLPATGSQVLKVSAFKARD
ncbi:MAG: hypothetical protein JWM16_3315, partial [Verrucomicrobiales bacterium]|nr:hypothetical protein [Verrucomicrobiales bacterium]